MNINKWSVFAGMHRGTLRTRVKSWVPKGWDVFSGTRIEGKAVTVEGIEQVIKKIAADKRAKKRPSCHVCGRPVRNYTSGNQVYCKYTEKQKKRYGKLTSCQLKAKSKVVVNWKNRITRNAGPKNVDSVESYRATTPLFEIVDIKMRDCVGLLSTESELGPHKFKSSGPHHRICDRCHGAAEGRGIVGKQATKVVFGGKEARQHG
jgi:hypothetical protein